MFILKKYERFYSYLVSQQVPLRFIVLNFEGSFKVSQNHLYAFLLRVSYSKHTKQICSNTFLLQEIILHKIIKRGNLKGLSYEIDFKNVDEN
jgi:hypothetical protein